MCGYMYLSNNVGWRKENYLFRRFDRENGNLSDIQKEFIKQAAVQCGFCTPGFILRAVEIILKKWQKILIWKFV